MSAPRPPDRPQSPRVGADVILRAGSPARPLQGRAVVTAKVSYPGSVTADIMVRRRLGSTASLPSEGSLSGRVVAGDVTGLRRPAGSEDSAVGADVTGLRGFTSRANSEGSVLEEDDVEVILEEEPEQRGPVPSMYVPLSSGEGASIQSTSREAEKELNEAFYKAKGLLLPGISQCEFDFDKDLVIPYVAGVEQSPHSLRELVVEAEARWVREGGEPGTVVRAVEKCARAFEIASGSPVRFSLTQGPVSERDRVQLRRPEVAKTRSVLTRLPALPPYSALLDPQRAALRACYQESFNRAMQMAHQAGFSAAEMNEGAQRIGIAESMLFATTAQMQQGLDARTKELAALQQPPPAPQTPAEQKQRAGKIQEVKKQIEELQGLLQKVNVDRFALYLGILFTPDQSSSDDFGSRRAEADAQAARLKACLDAELTKELESMQPSKLTQIWARVANTPLKGILPVPDTEYAVKVGSLVYAHLPEVEARVAGSAFLNQNRQYATAPAAEAGWVELACGTTRVPKQLSTLMEEFSKVMHPTDPSARDAVTQGFQREVMAARACPMPTAAAGMLTAQEIEAHYFP
jgi:hypothetical protein